MAEPGGGVVTAVSAAPSLAWSGAVQRPAFGASGRKVKARVTRRPAAAAVGPEAGSARLSRHDIRRRGCARLRARGRCLPTTSTCVAISRRLSCARPAPAGLDCLAKAAEPAAHVWVCSRASARAARLGARAGTGASGTGRQARVRAAVQLPPPARELPRTACSTLPLGAAHPSPLFGREPQPGPPSARTRALGLLGATRTRTRLPAPLPSARAPFTLLRWPHGPPSAERARCRPGAGMTSPSPTRPSWTSAGSRYRRALRARLVPGPSAPCPRASAGAPPNASNAPRRDAVRDLRSAPPPLSAERRARRLLPATAPANARVHPPFPAPAAPSLRRSRTATAGPIGATTARRRARRAPPHFDPDLEATRGPPPPRSHPQALYTSEPLAVRGDLDQGVTFTVSHVKGASCRRPRCGAPRARARERIANAQCATYVQRTCARRTS